MRSSVERDQIPGGNLTTIALAIPFTPWVPERVASMDRLREALGHPLRDRDSAIESGKWPTHYREFTDRAPNSVWCVQLWTYLYETGADWCLTLQDDCLVAPCFWPALRAMLSALPPEAEVIGLTSVHPGGTEIARRGHRWYRTPGNVVGWAYAMRRDTLGEFLKDRTALGEKFQAMNEDEQVAMWADRSRRFVWHPVPAICDHDTSIPSSYSNDHHSNRRPPVTWRTFDERELTDPEWWKPSGVPEMLGMPPQRACCLCGKEKAVYRGDTGLEVGAQCVANVVAAALTRVAQ